MAVSLGAGGIGLIARAAGNSAPSSFVSITPCRLFDTRPASVVGDRSTPLNAGEELVRQVTGTNGHCSIPSTATAISYNLTVPTSINGYLTVFPADATRPAASSINPVAGEQVKANGGIVGLSATGAIKVYTLTGPVDALLDITGYFLPASAGPPAPEAYAATIKGGISTTEATSTVTSLSVPAGSYIVSANFYAQASNTILTHYIVCYLSSGTTLLIGTQAQAVSGEYRVLSLQASVTIVAPGTLGLLCNATSQSSATVPAYTLYGTTLTAVAVSLHDQSPV